MKLTLSTLFTPLFWLTPLYAQAPEPTQQAPQQAPQQTPQQTISAPTVEPLKSFGGERALEVIKRYVGLGHRYYGAPQREAVIKRLREELSEGLKGDANTQTPVLSALERFEATERASKATYQLTNIIARFHPEREARLLLATHWDTRLWAEEEADASKRELPITGANDGTSGLAVLMELARLLRLEPLSALGVDVVLFDGEEFGRPKSDEYCKGSRHFAQRLSQWYPNGARPLAVFVLDMVGDATLTLPPERSSYTKAKGLTQLVWSVAAARGASAFVSDRLGPWIIDDHTPFQELGIPALLLIDYDYPHWHTQQDTLERVSAESLAQVGDVMWATLKQLDKQLTQQQQQQRPPQPSPTRAPQ